MNDDGTPFGPFFDAALKFTTAARLYLEESGQGDDHARNAAHIFGDFLRDQAGAWFTVAFWTPPLELPALGLTREHQQRAERAAAAARRAGDAQRRLQRLWFDALRDAAFEFVTRMAVPRAAMPDPPAPDAASVRKLYDCWIDCAEAAYAVIVRSDAFCDALADLVNAGSQWRLEAAAGVEHGAKLLDLPTRSELNSLTQRLAALEEQLRLEREQHAVATEPRARPRTRRTRRTPQS